MTERLVLILNIHISQGNVLTHFRWGENITLDKYRMFYKIYHYLADQKTRPKHRKPLAAYYQSLIKRDFLCWLVYDCLRWVR